MNLVFNCFSLNIYNVVLFCLQQHIPFQNTTRKAAQDDSARGISLTAPEIEVHVGTYIKH